MPRLDQAITGSMIKSIQWFVLEVRGGQSAGI
jgi:hypothetical protein